MNRTDVMVFLDTETMDTAPTAALISIGAVRFSIEQGIIDRFYTSVNLQSSLNHGLTKSQSTLYWWKTQSKEAIAAWALSKVTLPDAIELFETWFNNHRGQVWCQGVDFDLPIMRNAFQAVGKTFPVKHWSQMDSRTLFTLAGIRTTDMVRHGEFHNALGDAETCAVYLADLLDKMVD
jgi:DNA polymerase III epsilon subunit-like protein